MQKILGLSGIPASQQLRLQNIILGTRLLSLLSFRKDLEI
jgi:hypothetical protein